jgi:glutamate racemase
VTWIDPAPAIARRVMQLIGQPVPGHEADENEAIAMFTSGAGISLALRGALQEKGLPLVAIEDMPLLVG